MYCIKFVSIYYCADMTMSIAAISLIQSRALAHRLAKALLLASFGAALAASPGRAMVIAPTSLTVVVPTGSNNAQADGSRYTYSRTTGTALVSDSGNPAGASTAFVDDILLNSVTFGGTTFSSGSSNIVTVTRANLTPSGVFIDTSEINNGQELGVVGIDLTEFGVNATTAIHGGRAS